MSKKSTDSTEQVAAPQAEVKTANRTVKFHAFATTALATRRSYQIEGHKGCLVIERSLFADGDGPEELTLSVDLVEPKAKVGSVEKEAAKLAKAEERAKKAAEKLEAQQAKAEERKRKAEEALAKARAAAGETTPEATQETVNA